MSFDRAKLGLSPELQVERLVDNAGWKSEASLNADEFKHTASTEFIFPLSSPNLFVQKRSGAKGNVKITTSPDQAGDSATFKVHVKHNLGEDKDLSGLFHVLHLTRDGGENGVGIFDADNSVNEGVQVDYTITLPAVTDGDKAGTTIKKLELDIPDASYELQNLRGRVAFDYISLSSGTGSINAHHVETKTGIFRSNSGPITGYYYTSDSLQLQTNNAIINVTVQLQNYNNGQTTSLDMQTSNASLNASLNLTSSSYSGGSYNVNASTSKNYLNITTTNQPNYSSLTLSANTSHSWATVGLHPAFEGAISLSTTQGYSAYYNNSYPSDPTGQGRYRTVNLTNTSGNTLNGNVFWGNDSGSGSVGVNTSYSSVNVNI